MDPLAVFLFLMYFGQSLLQLGYTTVVGNLTFYYWAFTIVYLVGMALYFLIRSRRALLPGFAVFFIIAVIFGVTYFLHPEYKDWFLERTYGVQIQFLRCTGGIWAFWAILVVPKREDLYRCLKVAAWIIFLAKTLAFIQAQRRGYWFDYDANYNVVHISYNLGFGYEMLFAGLFFVCEAFLNRKPAYYIPFAAASVMVLLGGSRGSALFLILIFPAMFVYRWRTYSARGRVLMGVVIVLLIPVAILFYIYMDTLIAFGENLLNSIGLNSRTLERVLTGHGTDLSGRDDIWGITLERIRTGGLFGNGAFGERVAVGQKYRWGYAHNIFLEVYCAFGYVGGTLFFAVLLPQVFKTGVRCTDARDQIVFLTFAVSSLKLLLSDSFWYNSSFWGLLAIVWLWRQQDIRAGRRPPPRFRITWD